MTNIRREAIKLLLMVRVIIELSTYDKRLYIFCKYFNAKYFKVKVGEGFGCDYNFFFFLNFFENMR